MADEADELAAHLFDLGVERLFLIFVVEAGRAMAEHSGTFFDERS